ncbi:MAG: 50S ribosomal protein L7/L12 [bacterium]|uniref:Large ribosomal subunit protein bL12 n=2 Tax=Bacteria candidate phyla TaxID=1783234 RepID=A0A101HZV1_UNCT6|nr:MAG: 50S ribosomal protein L7/L12 [candidate division TA06 bacterium 32_111]KUK86436.1 MAG: 50S ribosomal protein L7/L12 [candidate division TA06 bacterium 34_109]MDI6700105.1 50S ribosomal protein L7/L12 [bacterium]HAF06885.1 50S ribosomal protein L7/L12 [candidate division WOR-3 bacterium]HCP16521.1 50S ribosomal protein L7/L12 [candidate division WOR-3 bacterium]
MSENKEKIIEMIEKMTVLELAELVEALKEKFGVTAAAPVAVAQVAQGGGQQAVEAEKTSATVVLHSPGQSKLQVIKAVKAILNIELKEAKEIVDAAPKEIKKNVPMEEAEKIKEQLEQAGAVVELK